MVTATRTIRKQVEALPDETALKLAEQLAQAARVRLEARERFIGQMRAMGILDRSVPGIKLRSDIQIAVREESKVCCYCAWVKGNNVDHPVAYVVKTRARLSPGYWSNRYLCHKCGPLVVSNLNSILLEAGQ